MRSCRNPEKLDSRTGAIFTVHDATSKLGILSRAVMVAVTTASPAVVHVTYTPGVFNFLI